VTSKMLAADAERVKTPCPRLSTTPSQAVDSKPQNLMTVGVCVPGGGSPPAPPADPQFTNALREQLGASKVTTVRQPPHSRVDPLDTGAAASYSEPRSIYFALWRRSNLPVTRYRSPQPPVMVS
jgi:hypothetical protein